MPVISDAPEDGADTGEGKADEETSAPSENAPEETALPLEESTPEQKPAQTQEQAPASEEETEPVEPPASNTTLSGTTLTLRFGGGEEFTINMYDNATANKIVEYVGTAAWQLPIYHYDDYDGWESFQYYDIPSRYEVPSNAETVTSEKTGEVYYSEPKRIVLFCHDAEISGEYTMVGRFDATEEFTSTVENNPVLEGWGNKIVQISAGE